MKLPNDSISNAEVTAGQLRAARALLGWSQDDLAQRAGITRRTIANIETGTKVPHRSTLTKLAQVLGEAGIRFLNTDNEVGVAKGL